MYKTLIVKEFKNDNALVIENRSLEELRKRLNATNFIVKVHSSPINPFDDHKISGEVTFLQCPMIGGSEASGVITESKRKEFIGKKVSFSSMEGTWTQYAVVSEGDTIILPDDADLSIASCGFYNPLTCLGLFDKAQKYGAKGIVNLAAQSALGKMINELARERGLPCLNVIRGNQDRVNAIKTEYKNDNVITLNQDNEQFFKQFKELTEKLQTNVIFDPISGSLTGQILLHAPANSLLVSYGYLSGVETTLNLQSLIWNNQTIASVGATTWLYSLSAAERQEVSTFIGKKINTIFKTSFDSEFSIEKAKDALKQFRQIKGGKKVLFKL